MKIFRLVAPFPIALGVAFTTLPAQAAVTAFFSAGKTCNGAATATFSPGGPDFQVALCASATEEFLCGHSIQLEAASVNASGRFQIVAHRMGEHYPDPTLEKQTAPIAITSPPSAHDFGGTRDNALPPSANQLLVVFTLRPMADAKEVTYTLRLGKNSLASVGKKGNCLESTESPMAASVKLERK